MGILDSLKSLLGSSINYQELIANGAIIVDVRTQGEFQSGNAKRSINIPLDKLISELNKLKDKELILVCRSGIRAGKAKSILKQNGITAHNAGAWQNLNK